MILNYAAIKDLHNPSPHMLLNYGVIEDLHNSSHMPPGPFYALQGFIRVYGDPQGSIYASPTFGFLTLKHPSLSATRTVVGER